MFRISDATEKDIPAIVQIAEQTWWPTYSAFISKEQLRFMLDAIYAPQTLKHVMINGSQQFITLHDVDGMVGFAAFGPRPENQRVFKLHKLYVLPKAHGKGYGKSLIDEIKRRMLEKKITTLDLNVNRYNPARFFYEKLGFRILREEDVPVGPYFMNDFVMRIEWADDIPGNLPSVESAHP